MNLALTEDQESLAGLAADVLRRTTDPDRLAAVETTADRFDRELWSTLAGAGLLGVVVPEEHGGLGLGMTELALVLDHVGRTVAPVPVAATAVAAAALAAHGSPEQRARWLPGLADGSALVVATPPPSTYGVHVDGDRLTGTAVGVPWAHVADAVLLVAGGRLWLLPLDTDVTTARGETTAREVALDLVLDGAAVEPVGEAGAADRFVLFHLASLAAVQAGVTHAAVRAAASYTSEREQFGKPLSTFQAVALKAADAHLDATAVRATALQAAWSLDAGVDAVPAVLTAAWWAAEAGQHCVHLVQHLHGGMGADVTYPVHRYFLWGKQVELLAGGAAALLADLGDALAARPDAGDNLVLD